MKARFALALLAVVALGFQTWMSVILMGQVFGGGPRAKGPFQIREGTRVVQTVNPRAGAKGLRAGDEILEVEGTPYDGSNDLLRALNEQKPGDTLGLKWRRDGVERESEIDLDFSDNNPFADDLVAVVAGVLTPLACLLVGFGVTLIRPHDRRAWILLLMMWSFANLTGFSDVISSGMPSDLAATTVVYRPLLSSLWGLGMMLFGWYFPAALPLNRKYPWAKWLLIVPIIANAISVALLAYRDQENHFVFGQLSSFYGTVPSLPFWITTLGLTTFFTAFGWREGTEKNPDAKRRLKLIRYGMYVSLLPIFIMILVGQIQGKDPFTMYPAWLMVPALLLLFVYPASLAYVIVVHRAMDLRVVVRQGLQYALASKGILVLRAILIGVVILLSYQTVMNPEANRPQRIEAIVVILVAIFWSRAAVRRFQAWLDKKFFREAVNTEKILAELGHSVRTMRETQPLLERVAQVVSETLHVDEVAMAVEENGSLSRCYAIGGADGIESAVAAVREKHAPVRMNDGERLALPLAAQDKLLGVMVLGPKKSEEPYTRSDIRLLESVAGQTGLALENSQLAAEVASEIAQRERMNRELEIAREVQERLFPQNLPPVEGLIYSGRCRPALSIGGDYYDFFPIPDGGMGIAIGDVSGKGVASALLMASLQGSLRSQAAGGAKDVGAMMANVNRLIYDLSPSNKYATFFYAQYEPAGRTLTYVNAGHNEPFILRGQEVLRLSEGGPVIGLFGPAKYQNGNVLLQNGDVLVGFTDGVSESMNSADDEWGEDQVIATAKQCVEGSPDRMIDELMKGADAFAAGAPQHDDMTLIVVKVL